MKLTRREFLAASGVLAASTALPGLAGAQDAYPVRPITYICPFPPGATNDVSARIIANKLSEILGQPVVVENKGGAGGVLGAGLAAKAAPDGYTLLNLSSGVLTTASQLGKPDFDPLTDIVPIGFFGTALSAIAVNPSLPVNSLKELIDYAKANPGKVNFGSAGVGSSGHLAGEHLKLLTGIDIVHIPYGGGAPALNDTIAGRVQLLFDVVAATAVRSGQLKGLAFYGPDKAPEMNDVPSVADAGLPDWEVTTFYFTGTPKGLPQSVHDKLTAAMAEATADPKVTEALAKIGVMPGSLTPEDVSDRLRHDYEVNGQIIKAANIQPL